jgi:oxygen-independent coproporphyrinogen-3 oxidase
LEPRAAYIHVPFCRHHCGYCNFTVLAGRDDLREAYLEAVEREMASLGVPREVDSLFFGGGTPTHLDAAQLDRLFDAAQHWFPLARNYELSVEANPADLDESKMTVLAEHGVTRISLGVQSFDDAKLELLERNHRGAGIMRAYELARRLIKSVSLDLIFAVPGETVDVWLNDLRSALELEPDHVSTYGLTFERGTAFWSRLLKQQLVPADEELQRSMYEAAIDVITASGFEHYEVSNFARPGHRCRHNEVYWTGRGYYAVGPGASRFVNGRRETNHRSTTSYLRRVLAGESPTAECEQLDPPDAARERLVFSLRRLEGVDRTEFARETGYAIDDLVGAALGKYEQLGMLQIEGPRIRLTREGLLVSDAIWPDFLNV